MDQLRVAIVGCGRISDLHELGYRNFDKAKIVAVCDRSQVVAESKAIKWNVPKVFTDYNELLQSDEIDMIELLVPHHLHAPMVIAACKAKKHVSVQKPMALSLDEADEMIAVAQENGVSLRVFENFIFYPPILKVKEMIHSGAIGDPRMIRVHYNSGTLDSSWKVPLKAWLWRFDSKRCGGGPIIFDHGYHLFSVALNLMGPVEKVSAWIDKTQVFPTKYIDGPATIMLKFRSPRCYGVMDFSHTPQMRINSDYYADDNRIEIVGDTGIIQINKCTTSTFDLPAVLLYKNGTTTVIETPRTDWKHSFIDATHHFVNSIQSGSQPSLDGTTARDILKVVLAAQYSSTERREIDVEEVKYMTP